MSWLWIILIAVALQRLAELALAARNTRHLLAQGAHEIGAAHYPLFVLLHGSWLVALAIMVPRDTPPNLPLLGVFALLQLGRIWVMVSLGRFWTTRIVTLPEAPLVSRGPYRWVRHPNYWIVAGEIVVLPLVFGQWIIALVWTILNALLLRHRIRLEESALAPRSI